MPFLSPNEQSPRGPVGALPPEPEALEAPGIGETFGAAFRLDNPVASFIADERPSLGLFDEPADPEFDPFADIEGYEEHSGAFVRADTPEEVETIKMQIDREREDRETLEASGALGMAATLSAGLLDPLILVPFGGAATASARAGQSVLKSGLSTARAGFLGMSASEAALQATQETRTAGETALNVAGATLLSGIAGAGVRAIGKRFGKAANRLEQDLEPREIDPIEPGQIKITPEELAEDTGSVGAKAVRDTTMAEETLKSALGLEKRLARTNPLLRAATSPSLETRRTVQELVETPFFYEKNSLGIASPVSAESEIRLWTAPMGRAIETMDELFVKHRQRQGGRATRAAIGARDTFREPSIGDLKYREFRAEIGRAMRRGDEHEIPEVAEAAKVYRREVFDPLKERAIRAGLLPEGVDQDTAVSYLTRVYDINKINAQRDIFRERIVAWLKRERDRATQKLTEREADLAVAARAAEARGDAKAAETVTKRLEKAREDASKLARAEDIELDDMAEEIIDHILGTPNGRVPYEPVTLHRGPLKERVFNIPDLEIEDFLLSDVEIISRFYVRTMAPDVELAIRFGSPDLDAPLDRITADYNRKLAALTDDDARAKMAKRRESDLKDLAALRDRLRGTYGAPVDPNSMLVRGFRVLREWNYLRILGGVVISSLPDIARPVMTEGLWRVFRTGLAPVVTNLKGVRLAGKEAKLAGTAWDMILDTRALSLADLGDEFGRHTRFEKGLQSLSANFGLVNLMSPWNTAMKQFAATVSGTRILEETGKWARGSIKKTDIEKLAAGGIDKDMAERIAKQFKQHGKTERGVAIANTQQWTDAEAVRAFRSALAREVDKTIVTPGAGDRPLWMSKELGKVIGQFRSFAFAATNRILIPALQQRDVATLNGAALTLGVGAVVYFLKTVNGGREPSDDPRQWVAEAVDRSGLTGWLMDVHNITEKGSRGVVGMSALTGGPTMSRYAVRNAVGSLLGPTFGLGEEAFKVTGAAATGELTRSEVKAVRRLLPYQNLFYLRALLNAAEEETAEKVAE